jgi:hypothetical protein
MSDNMSFYQSSAVVNRLIRRLAAALRLAIPDGLLFPIYNLYGAAKVKKLLSEIKNADRLEHFGRQVYSQNEEDGIIAEIFRRIGTSDKTFVEFGCGDGRENNTRLLLDQGWGGLWIDGAKSNVETARQRFHEPISAGHLKIIEAFITRENINELIALDGHAGGAEVDLLVIDIDGNDAYVWEAIDVISPRVVCIEYNAYFGSSNDRTIEYDPTFHYVDDGRHIFGASLKLLERIGGEKNYALVGCNLTGVNAFFVRDDLVGDKFIKASAAEFFHSPRFRLRRSLVSHFR